MNELEHLLNAYALKLPYRVAQIETFCRSLGDHSDVQAETSLLRLLHTLMGSGKTFGYEAMGSAARTLHAAVKSYEETQDRAGVLAALEALKTAAALPPSPVLLPESAPMRPLPLKRNVYLAEQHEALAKTLSAQLGYFDYEVLVCPNLVSLKAALAAEKPLAVISEVELPEGNAAYALGRLSANQRPETLLFIARRGDLAARLEAVRAGAAGYFVKPFDPARLVDRLDELFAARAESAYRVLVVDESETLGQMYALILQRFGMEAYATDNPAEVLDAIERFNPELVVLDMYMSGFQGDEIARVIRQHERFFSLPIVFLSAETDLQKQLSALSGGGDEFLVKPIEPEHLALAVQSRVMRSRELGALMVRDSLTGLLNHTETKKQLDLLLERARRSGRPLCFAMIDIDRFKRVNDTYGHPVGDRVIKSLSRLLTRRLRKGDVVGRYGGEEFAVILPETDIQQALKVLNNLREHFGEILHRAESETFNCTFSAGIAAFPAVEHAAKLIEEADKALYTAKQNGRNWVEKA
ncbi:MAG: diguanylate cyclase [Campylobacterales bacterium]